MATIGQTRRGKWSEPGVPHRGWRCVEVQDLGHATQSCDMCESVEIRYVHVMHHPDYPEPLGVGCVCAEHMEEDRVNPRRREHLLKSKARRRRSWRNRVWNVSAKGNAYINAEGFNVTVFPVCERDEQRWRLRVSNRKTGASQLGRHLYNSENDAMDAGLDALLWAKRNLTD
jgi:hypothetical protein